MIISTHTQFFYLSAIGTLIYFAFAYTLSIIDYQSRLLPDSLTLPLIWLGLLFHCLINPFTVDNAIYGAMAGYIFLWIIYWMFRLCTGREGLGYGDFKLLAAIGAWNGWQSLPTVVIIASLSGILFFLSIFITGKIKRYKLPFGPYLAAAGWGEFIWKLYG